MHTSQILKEALAKLTRKFPENFELSIVLFSISVERLMKQHLYEIDAMLVLDKNNNTKHLVKFRKLYNKIQNENFKEQLELLTKNRENFRTLGFDELIKRYDAFFGLNEERKIALKRLTNLRNNIVHYFQYYIDEVEEGLFILNEIIPFLRELTTEVSDSEKYDDLFNRDIIKKLQRLANKLTKIKNNKLHQKIIKGECLVCGLELTEEDIKSLESFYNPLKHSGT